MIVLVLTDLHSQTHIFPRMESTLDRLKPDAAFCLGDLTDGVRTAVNYTQTFLRFFQERNVALYAISGNNDAPASLELLKASDALIDYQVRDLEGTQLIGIGYEGADQPFQPDLRGGILLTHLPPRRNSVPKAVLNVPRFHFSGHYHSREQMWRMNETLVIQVPTAQKYRGAVLRLPEGKVEFIGLE